MNRPKKKRRLAAPWTGAVGVIFFSVSDGQCCFEVVIQRLNPASSEIHNEWMVPERQWKEESPNRIGATVGLRLSRNAATGRNAYHSYCAFWDWRQWRRGWWLCVDVYRTVCAFFCAVFSAETTSNRPFQSRTLPSARVLHSFWLEVVCVYV